MAIKPDKKLQQLIDTIVELEAKEKEIHTQLVCAQSERFQYERELRRTQKPTDAMMYVLKAMTRGATLTSYEWNHPYRYGLQLPKSEQAGHVNLEYIKSSVFSGLCSREAIERDENKKGVFQYGYKLTDYGREIASRA